MADTTETIMCDKCGERPATTYRIYRMGPRELCRPCGVDYDNLNCECDECKLDHEYERCVRHGDIDGMMKWGQLFAFQRWLAGSMSALVATDEGVLNLAFDWYAKRILSNDGPRAELIRQLLAVRKQAIEIIRLDKIRRKEFQEKKEA